MSQLRIKINQQDYDALNKKLTGLSRFIQSDVNEIVSTNGKIVAQEMRDDVPVDTGRLQRNILAVETGDGLIIDSDAVNNGYDYAPVIEEYGGRYQRGLHYFSKGIQRFKQRVLDEVKTGVRKIITSKLGSTRQQGKVRTYTPRK